jgi:hypothetical protein
MFDFVCFSFYPAETGVKWGKIRGYEADFPFGY